MTLDVASLIPGQKLRLLSYNIQAGIETNRYRHYVTRGWKHVLPHRGRVVNLQAIAKILTEYDVIGLQEVDSGSLRTGFLDMTEYLARQSGHSYWYRQVNRDIGMLAQNSNGLISRIQPSQVSNHRLPPGNGRGAMLMEFGVGRNALRICSMHLALSRRQRQRQLDFISELTQDSAHLIVMGDLNAGCDSREVRGFIESNALSSPACSQPTFPSWAPIRRIDHILVSNNLQVENAEVVDYPLSDHLPISIDVIVPDSLYD
jgi:endonuclease/exonuclease/phosphatase family metal-dependent hydrolase